jgi:hypothetical protein
VGKTLEKAINKVCGSRILGLSSWEIPVAFLDLGENCCQLGKMIDIAGALSRRDASPSVGGGRFSSAEIPKQGGKSAAGV